MCSSRPGRFSITNFTANHTAHCVFIWIVRSKHPRPYSLAEKKWQLPRTERKLDPLRGLKGKYSKELTEQPVAIGALKIRALQPMT